MTNNRDNLALVLLIFAVVNIACDGFSTVHGHVSDPIGRPVAGAVVKLEEVGYEQKYGCKTETDREGAFECGLVHAPLSIPLRLSVAQTGFKIYQTEFTSDDAHKKLEAKEEFKILLEKE